MTNSNKLKVGILGGSGYVGHELLRLLWQHPLASVCQVTSREQRGKPISFLHPDLEGLYDLTFCLPSELKPELDLVFVCAPHGESMNAVSELKRSFSSKLKVIDLGADFRLPLEQFKTYYALEHAAPTLLNQAVYGTPELNSSQIATADLVANPGCFAHCVILGLAPLAQAGLLNHARVSAITGSSGSGIQPNAKTHHPERNDSISAYNIFSHRHVPEIQNALFRASNNENVVTIDFVPLSGPFSRGIFATIFVNLGTKVDINSLYQTFAAEHEFVRLRSESPRLLQVRGTNFCDLFVQQRGNEVVVLSAIDNLVKGAAGNAIQCMNLMFKLPASTGLILAPLLP